MTAYPNWVSPATRPLCINSGRPLHADRPTVPGTDLCGPCHTTFIRNLTLIVDVWDDLKNSVMRSPARVYDQPTSHGGDTPDASTYWNPAATLVVADITDWAYYLHRTIQRDRWDLDWTGWTFVDGEDPKLTLSAIVRWHARWLTHYPAVGPGLLRDVQQFAWAIEKALNTVPVQRITLTGHVCHQVITETEYGPVLCEGQLVGTLRPGDERRPSAIVCSNHPDHDIPRHEWIHIGILR